MPKTTNDLAALDEQIAAGQRDVDAAQNRYRNRPRGTPMMGGGNAPLRIDPVARADMLDRGLAVDDAVIRLEELKKQRAELVLAELEDPQTIMAENAAVDAAQRDLAAAEAAEIAARKAYQVASGVRKFRADRIKTQHAELARAEAAIRSAQVVRGKEQAQRDELVVA
jgi:hypothetical protein